MGTACNKCGNKQKIIKGLGGKPEEIRWFGKPGLR
jgi:hypothetical protein